ncbi:carbonic anhydrase [Leucobacter sp. M11]|uniref:carbonic anhydrase n=1 Tax=Leucobacter sp. M11 TaxID=2993565 RepID=UPI002D80FB32|nr:carbonic anhydrase [Leucobacter sp. M11]MEB4615129.1 hypothetical protein [Leucobacter sp. M11]
MGNETESHDRVLQIRWVSDTSQPAPVLAETSAEAVALLDAGSTAFSRLGEGEGPFEIVVDPEAFGVVHESDDDGILNQEPFAAVLSCSDARVPIELTLGRAGNDLFVVRVAGNVPGSECIGSLHYAADHLPTIKVFAIVGHSNCGAVTAAVDSLLSPSEYLPIARLAPLRGIVDSLFGGIRMAVVALERATGVDPMRAPDMREALIAVSALANTALTAAVVARELGRDTVFGVYDLEQRIVGTRGAAGWAPGFVAAPRDDRELSELITGSATRFAELLGMTRQDSAG